VNADRLPAWQVAEYEHDLAREQQRRDRMYERRDRHFWPPVGATLLIAAPLTVALIEGLTP
jgi:hypothetical protein